MPPITATIQPPRCVRRDTRSDLPLNPQHQLTQGPIVLVCCATTKGPLSIAVHSSWAPRGAARFVAMVKSGYFSSRVPLFRCVKNFICQVSVSVARNQRPNGNGRSLRLGSLVASPKSTSEWKRTEPEAGLGGAPQINI